MSTEDVPHPWASAMIAAGAIDPRRKTVVPSINALAGLADLSAETVRRMIRGIGTADQDSVNAVADALREDRVVVSGWVRQARTLGEDWTPPSDSALLSDDERRALDRLISLMVSERKTTAVADLSRAVLGTRSELQALKHQLAESGVVRSEDLRVAEALVDAHLRSLDRAIEAAGEHASKQLEDQIQEAFAISIEIHALAETLVEIRTEPSRSTSVAQNVTDLSERRPQAATVVSHDGDEHDDGDVDVRDAARELPVKGFLQDKPQRNRDKP